MKMHKGHTQMRGVEAIEMLSAKRQGAPFDGLGRGPRLLTKVVPSIPVKTTAIQIFRWPVAGGHHNYIQLKKQSK